MKAFEEGYIIKTRIGKFKVTYGGLVTVGVPPHIVKGTMCSKCAIRKILIRDKVKDCKTILHVLFDIPEHVGCLLKPGLVFELIEGGI